MSDHDDFRQALLDGEINAAVTAHLETCADCSHLAAALDRLEETSPLLLEVHPPPTGLADRVLARVRAEHPRAEAQPEAARVAPAPDPATPTPEPGDRQIVPLRRRARRNLWVAATAAAAVVAVVATSIVLRGGDPSGPSGDERREILLVAADNTAAQDTARVEMDGSVDIELLSPLSGTGTFEVASDGTVAFPDRIDLTSTISTTDDTSSLLAVAPESTQLRRVGTESWTRTPGQQWEVDDDDGGGTSLTRALFEPDATLDLLRSADTAPTDLGVDTVDGERLHGYRFTVPPDLWPQFAEPLEGPPNGHTVELYVSEDDQVMRRIVVTSEGESHDPFPVPLRWRSVFDIEYSDFGVAVDIEPPAPEDVTP